MLSVDQRRKELIKELERNGIKLRKHSPSSLSLERKAPTSLPQRIKNIQALDTIEFECEYQQNKVELVRFNLDNQPGDVKNAIAKVPPNEKRIISATYILSSIGTGLGSTIGMMTRFSAPIAIGGAGLTIGASLMVGLTAGCGIIALCLAYFVRKYYTKEAFKKVGLLREQIDHYDTKLCEKAIKVEHDLNKAFAMLLKMKCELNILRKIREEQNLVQSSDKEETLEMKINYYINFLVIDPEHPNLNLIEDYQKKREATERAIVRQDKIRLRLNEACNLIETKKTTIDKYIKYHPCEVRRCFPSLHLVAPKIKTSLRDILFTPSVGLTILGGFTGSVGLSYSMLGIISMFTVISMSFPPLYPILGIGFIGSFIMGCAVYKIKKTENKRKAHLKNQQKYLAYLTRADKLLTERYTHELEDYVQYKTIPKEPEPTSLASSPSSTPPIIPILERKPAERDLALSLFVDKPLGDLSFRDSSQQPSNENNLNCNIF